MPFTKASSSKLYILLISVHGLIRYPDMELGRDADTGGQTKYVLELLQALSEHPEVGRVDLLTRQIFDGKVANDYSQAFDAIAPDCNIIRLPCGPRRYLRKEVLWNHLDSFTDQALQYIRRVGKIPDVIHSHYADAGYVGTTLSGYLGVPHIFTGHSLGRLKAQRLMEKGTPQQQIESRFNITRRIEAEEETLSNASFVVASTAQEIEEQYSLYDHYRPERMLVINPGLNLSQFYPPKRNDNYDTINTELSRFLKDKNKPMILALSRPDEKKNIETLIRAYAETPHLREQANLVLVIGNRDDIQSMEKGPREVISRILYLIDLYDLYGSVAYPKTHNSNDIPNYYRLASKTKGVFINPAISEPFGLTLIEAAASGLPVIATQDGGPRDILASCNNGLLINPLDTEGIGMALLDTLSNPKQWMRWAKNGLQGVQKHFSWEGHIKKYLKAVHKKLNYQQNLPKVLPQKCRLPTAHRLLICDIDNTLLGDKDALSELMNILATTSCRVGFGVATGRNIESTLQILEEWNIPIPDLLITSVGSEIHYDGGRIQDHNWSSHISPRWNTLAAQQTVEENYALNLQDPSSQRPHKISYLVSPEEMPNKRDMLREFRKKDLATKLIYSHNAYLDILPARASKGMAVHYIALKWGISLNHILVAGDSGNDEEMLMGDCLGVVVGNYSSELEKLRGSENVYFAEKAYARGIIEAIEHYNFIDDLPQSTKKEKLELSLT